MRLGSKGECVEIIITTVVSTVLAIAAAAAVFFGMNALIDATADRWAVAVAGLGGVLGLIVGAILQHNGWLKLGGDLGGPFKEGWLTLLLGVIVGAAAGYGLGTVREPDYAARQRTENRWRPVAFVGPAIAFVLLGLAFPSLSTLIISFREGRRGEGGFSLSNYEAIFTDEDFFNVIDFDRIFTSRLFIVGLLAVIVAVLAAYASAVQLDENAEARMARTAMRVLGLVGAVLGGLAVIGLIEGIARDPNRSWIYDNILTPLVSSRITLWALVAIFFAGGALYLFAGRDERAAFVASEPRSRFGMSPSLIAVLAVAAVLTVVLGIAGAISTAEFVSLILLVAGLTMLGLVLTAGRFLNNLDLGSPTSSLAMVVAAILLALAMFSSLESVLWNNLWWVATVTGLSTVFGLLLAILADRARGEIAARTFIFLPMAISMVGAAVIWDFVFELRAFGNQTGLMNAILQGVGFQPRGFFINSSMIPWNNFWIMLIMVWIQTGFAMVILSASIKGVPDELIEAARVDGASEVQVFWRVIIPQIRTTIIVVVTTLIIIVMKVFDLVKATTGGANRTNVLANEMFNQLRDANFSLSSAFAVLIFALVLPVMIYNVRGNLKEIA